MLRANIAAAAGGIIFFCLYLPYSFMVVWEEVLNPNAKILSCLVSNIAFGFGCAYFSHYEESGVGAQWSNIWTSPLTDDKFSLAGCMLMMILDSVIYGESIYYKLFLSILINSLIFQAFWCGILRQCFQENMEFPNHFTFSWLAVIGQADHLTPGFTLSQTLHIINWERWEKNKTLKMNHLI